MTFNLEKQKYLCNKLAIKYALRDASDTNNLNNRTFIEKQLHYHQSIMARLYSIYVSVN
jgi:hypothetical protein